MAKKKINVEERLLGMMAVEKRFITEKQLTECLNTIELFQTDRTLEQVFLDKEYLTKPQIDRLRQQLQASTEVKMEEKPNTQIRFGDIAIEQNMIDTDQLNNALQEQKVYHERAMKVQIGQILYKKGLLTMAQVGRILESQLKKVLYCKGCKTTTVINSYIPSKIYQCEKCQLDLIEAKVKKAAKQEKQKKEDDEDIDGDIGNLEVLEL